MQEVYTTYRAIGTVHAFSTMSPLDLILLFQAAGVNLLSLIKVVAVN